MDRKPVPFWEKSYSDDSVVTFSAQPNATVKEFQHLISKDARILEVGCGEGQNSIYLAQQGYGRVDAFDLSENGIAKLRRLCDAKGVQVNAFAADLTEFVFRHNYDMIICFGTLHFVPGEDWKEFIRRAKEHTGAGGVHIMQIFTDTVPASEDIAPFAVGLAKEGELKELYSDWEILQFKSHVFEDEHPGVPRHMHASNKIVARKKG